VCELHEEAETESQWANPSLFVHQRNGKKLIVAIYKDDGFITERYQSETDVLILVGSISLCYLI
jgi:hypothetical protein